MVGRARITPAAGTAVYMFAADGTRCGLLVDGLASLTYRVEDPFSVPVARRNLKRVGGLSVTEAGGVLTIAGSLRGAAIWGWNLDVGAVSPQTGRTLPDWWREQLRRRLGTNPARDMLGSAVNAAPGYRWAALRGTNLGVRGCLEEWLGVPYPFQDLHLVEVREWGWGQAPPGVIFITQEAFISEARSATLDDATRTVAQQVSRGINERLAHEVTHGWFPHVTKIARGEDNWLSESVSDYVSAV